MATRKPKTIGRGGTHQSQPFSKRPKTGGGSVAFHLEKKFGQHLLKNPGVLEKIIAAAEIKSTDTVLEIGPGTGNLTIRLLPLARKVIALDVDERMIGEVKKRAMGLGYKNLDVRHGDALRSAFDPFDVCAANLPYQISSPFIFKLLAHRPWFRCAVLMFQKEFAERLCAQPGDASYSRLAVNTQLFVRVDRVCTVKAGSFIPPPKVDSMVVKLVPKKPQPQIDFSEWDGMLRVCFMRKRRTLYSNFTTKAVLSLLEHNYKAWCAATGAMPRDDVPMKDRIQQLLEDLQLAKARPVSLAAEDYFRLLVALNKNGLHLRSVQSGTHAGVMSPVPDAFSNLDKDFYMSMTHDDDDDDDTPAPPDESMQET